MNKAKFLAACVCATAASQASAATEPVEALIVFECADFQVSPPEPKDRDPVYKATIKVGWNSAVVDHGVLVRPPQSRVRYVAFCDPSGGQGDSFTCAIAHREGDIVVLDCLIEIVPI
jgi:hypothetical protein